MADANGKAHRQPQLTKCSLCNCTETTSSFCLDCTTLLQETPMQLRAAPPTPMAVSDAKSVKVTDNCMGLPAVFAQRHHSERAAAMALLQFQLMAPASPAPSATHVAPIARKSRLLPQLAAGPEKVIAKKPGKKSSSARLHKKRCHKCKKRVGLLGFQCRCGPTFCSSCRYEDKHDCGFDYRSASKSILARQNPLVIAQKLAERV